MISTRNLSELPDIDALRRLMQSLAILDAILCPEWEFRYFSFNSKWSKGEQMGSMRNGSGDDLFAHFTLAGCFIKGFDHNAAMSPKRVWPGVLDAVPKAFAKSLREPAFSMDDTTFCIWRLNGDAAWSCGDIKYPKAKDPDGSRWLLSYYDGKPTTYRKYAAGYFRKQVPLAVVRAVYAHQPLTEEMVEELNPEMTLKKLAADLTEIGYPAG
jgi:hypothetical protein